MHNYRLILTAITLTLFSACGGNSEQQAGNTETAPADTSSVVEAPGASSQTTTPAQPAPEPEDNTARLVSLSLQSLLKEDLDKGLIDSASRVFKYSSYDLNDDGKKEIFVGLTGMNFCGSGGCTMYLLDNEGNRISRFTVVEYPVVVDISKTNGWRDLVINSGGKNRLVKFNGKTYPSNPSTQPEYKMTPGDDLPRMLVWENTPAFRY